MGYFKVLFEGLGKSIGQNSIYYTDVLRMYYMHWNFSMLL